MQIESKQNKLNRKNQVKKQMKEILIENLKFNHKNLRKYKTAFSNNFYT